MEREEERGGGGGGGGKRDWDHRSNDPLAGEVLGECN